MTTIRNARTYDAPALAALAGELGYPSTQRQIVARLAAIEAEPASRVMVAEDERGHVVGWLHVVQVAHLVDDGAAEIVGLVVADGARGGGIGARLLQAAEDWARTRGATSMRVRSRTERERAHRFYELAGYVRAKTQHVFAKPL